MNELIESLRQLSKPSETEESAADDSLWSRSFLKAANFIADKLAQPEELDQEGNKVKDIQLNPVDNGNVGEDSRSRRREPGRPLPRSSSVTRFASWARSTIRDAASAVAGTAARDFNGNQGDAGDQRSTEDQKNQNNSGTLPPTGNYRSARVSDISKVPNRMHKSSSVSG